MIHIKPVFIIIIIYKLSTRDQRGDNFQIARI